MLKGLLVLVCAFAATAQVAAAQDDQVFVDPGSPSGKEYALPIDRARQQAATRAKQRSGTQKAPLFGEGVNDGATAKSPASTRRKAPRSTAASGEGASSDAAARRRSRAAAARRAEAAAQARVVATRAAAREAAIARARTLRAETATPDGGIGLGGILGAGIGVLVLGGLIGLLMRRRALT